MDIYWIEYVLIVVLVLFNAFFAASEIALVTVRKSRVKQLAEEGNGSARSILRLTDNTGRFLSTIQVGVTLSGFFASAFGAVSLVKLFDSWIHAIPVDFIRDSSATLAFIIVTVLVAFITLIFGELIPKTLAVEASERVALITARPIELLSKVARPIIAMLTGITNFFVAILGGRHKASMNSVSEEEIVSMIETGQEEGIFQKQESEIINRVFEFTERQVREIMVPRMDVLMLESSKTIQEAAIEVIHSGYSRYPVCQAENREMILGIAYAKDILKALVEGNANTPVSEFLRKPYFIPVTKRVGDLLTELQKSRTQIAIVIDEYGGLAGLVSLEDCLEELVGDIQDEYDLEEKRIIEDSEGTFLVDGGINLNEVNTELSLNLNDDGVDTLGGLVLKELGRLATVGDSITFSESRQVSDTENPQEDEVRYMDIVVTITVVRMEGLRIRQVRIAKEEREKVEEGR